MKTRALMVSSALFALLFGTTPSFANSGLGIDWENHDPAARLTAILNEHPPTAPRFDDDSSEKKSAAGPVFTPQRHRDDDEGISIVPREFNACVEGDMSMDIDVYVDNERFRFDPSCAFSFDEDITTAKGVECEIEAGMCSPFSPKGRFEIECDDDRKASLAIACPDDDDEEPGAIAIVPEEYDACFRGQMSMEIAVRLDGEIFEFDPSCAFSFDDGFKTKKGLKCEVSAGMCSAFSPKNRFEVECEDDREASLAIACKD